MSMLEQIQSKVRDLRQVRLDWAEDVEGVESIGQSWEPFANGPGEVMWIPTPQKDATVLLYRGAEHSIFDLHAHQPSESAIVLGSVEVLVDGERRILGNGDTIEIPSMTEHGWAFLEDTVLLLSWTPAFPLDPGDEDRVLWGATPEDAEKYNHTHRDYEQAH